MKKKVYLTIIWVITIFIILLGIAINTLSFFDFSIFPFSIGVNRATESYEFSAFSGINIDANVLEVRIEVDKEGRFRAVYEGQEKHKPSCELEKGELVVRQNLKKANNVKNCKLTIYVPENTMLDSVESVVNVGEFYMEGIQADKTNVKINVGECELKNSSVGDTEIDVNIGSVKIKDCDLGDVVVDVDTGSIDARINNSNVYGYDLTTNLGTVSYFGNEFSHNYRQDGEGKCTINMNVNIGSITVK